MTLPKMMRWPSIALLSATAILMTACDDDEAAPDYAAPVLTIDGSSTQNLKPGEDISVDLTINAEGGLSSIIVNRNGGFLEEVDLPDPDVSTFTYTGESVPATASEGETIAYEFIGVNTQDEQSAPVAFNVDVTVYDEITIGSTSVYEVAIPVDGVIPDGTTVKFAAGRNYYLAQPAPDVNITFAEGSSFVIEEGVTVYMQSGVSLEITVNGTVDVRGTASDPVVMTSENVISGQGAAEAGDWQEFQIEGPGPGTNSGVFRYVRLEYGGDRAFIIDNVGSGTEISHIQVWNCTDEAFFIGGDSDVNLSYLIATNSEDTNYRLEDNYNGNMQFIISVSSVPGAGDEAMYLRGSSSARIANVTVIGPGAEFAADGEPDGIRFWSAQGNKVYNAAIAGLPSWGVRAQQSDTDGRPLPTDIDGPVVLAYSHVFDNGETARDDAAIFFSEASFNNSTEAIAGIGAGSFVPSQPPVSAFDPATLDDFFAPAAFVGAVENAANDWTAGWVKNPDGTIR